MGCLKLTYDQTFPLLKVTHSDFLAKEKKINRFFLSEEKSSAGKYRYSFGGHEKDDEVSGNGNHLVFGDYGYNPRLGRRFNVDPMTSKIPQWSPYSTFADNPLYYVDPSGNLFIDFDENGKYKKTSKDNFFHNLFHGKKGRILNANGDTKRKFKFAHPEEDIKDIQNGVIKRIIVVKEAEIKSMVVNSGAFREKNRAKPYDYISKEGVGRGKFDFSYGEIPKEFNVSSDPLEYPSDAIFLVDNMAHNHMNFGNFVYGVAGATLGVTVPALLVGGHKNSMFPDDGKGNRFKEGEQNLNNYIPQWDSSDDQLSIKKGFHYGRGGGLISRWFGGRRWDKEKAKKQTSVTVGKAERSKL